MPIYEFRCPNCSEYTELLIMNGEEEIEIKCRICGSEELERIISRTNYNMSSDGEVGVNNNCASTENRLCSSGSCTTYNMPGPS